MDAGCLANHTPFIPRDEEKRLLDIETSVSMMERERLAASRAGGTRQVPEWL